MRAWAICSFAPLALRCTHGLVYLEVFLDVYLSHFLSR
ncbi:hypothetical protein K30_001 [Salmonella phage Kenya-K30]|nr:hypothetical protein K30_001 [Salmonella phage Kenya-K30]